MNVIKKNLYEVRATVATKWTSIRRTGLFGICKILEENSGKTARTFVVAANDVSSINVDEIWLIIKSRMDSKYYIKDIEIVSITELYHGDNNVVYLID